jgi:hypothetical protein
MSVSFDPKFIRFGKVASTTLNTNLISYYKLEEASGTLNDSVGTNHLSAYGTPTYNAAGKSNYGINFGNIGDAAACITSTGFPMTTAGSVSLWVRFNQLPTTTGDAQFIFRACHTGTPYYSMACDLEPTTNEWWFGARDSAGTAFVVVAAAPSTATWYHLVCVAEAGSPIRIYINNSRTNSGDGNLVTGLLATDEEFCVGNGYDGDARGAMAIIDEVAVYSKALTDAEVTELYNSGTGKFYPFS